jgi:SAM-dependent methyltransferase
MNNKSKLETIAKQTCSRYSQRYREMGYNVRTLGWGSTEQQELRFDRVLNTVNLNGRHILDIGCGFGDLLTFCLKNNTTPSKYTGWDINPDLIEEAEKRHAKEIAKFSVVNLTDSKEHSNVADVGIMLGLLNFNLGESFKNIDYTKMMLTDAFECVSEALVVDFLSTNLDPEYPKEDFVFYHNPAEILEFALTLTPNVKLIHDYPAIPQKEFILVLHK